MKYKITQKFEIINGINKNLCYLCNEIINYPDGVYFRNGVEVHSQCVTIARQKKIFTV